MLNAALPNPPDEAKRQIFVMLIEQMTVWHLRILYLFANPQKWFSENGKSMPQWSIGGSLSQLLTTAYPELQNQPFFITDNAHATMQAFEFLDVAQGTCQVLLIGNRTAIILDSGARNGRIPLQFLKRMGVDRVAALLTTHSHEDHMGGAVSILGEYQDMIDVVGFVKDDQFLKTAYWARLSELIQQGLIQRNQLVKMNATQRHRLSGRMQT